MQILMLLENEFPPDNRVEKEIKSLVEEGHKVDIACITRQQRPKFEAGKHCNIYRIPLNNWMYKLSAATLIVPAYFRFWMKFVNQLFKQNHYDAIHVHDLPLAKVGYTIKKKYGVKLICDQHEYYSNWIIHTAHYNTGLGKIINKLSDWKKYEKKYLHKADLVITVEEPLRQCYIDDVGLTPEKVILVPNTPSAEIFNPQNVDRSLVEKYKNDFVLFYAGGIDKLRGLELPVKAMETLQEKIPNLKLVIAGPEAKNFSIIQLAEKHHVQDKVEYLKWIDIENLPSYIAASKVTFFTPPGNRDEIHRTIATKIYQYMAIGTPVIVSNVDLMKQFVEKHKAGYVVKNHEDFEKACIELYKKPAKWQEIHKNCLKAAPEFIWESTIKKMLQFYAQSA